MIRFPNLKTLRQPNIKKGLNVQHQVFVQPVWLKVYVYNTDKVGGVVGVG